MSKKKPHSKTSAHPPFQRGDLVTTTFCADGDVVRRVIECKPSATHESGWVVSVDGGAPCPSCGRPPSEAICGIDSGWLKKVAERS